MEEVWQEGAAGGTDNVPYHLTWKVIMQMLLL